jgi:hypothetical protein
MEEKLIYKGILMETIVKKLYVESQESDSNIDEWFKNLSTKLEKTRNSFGNNLDQWVDIFSERFDLFI